ncbi:MAG: RHS repeat-associated core domain-containing protein, partial [Magnetococcus sp. WYHC-3]
LFIFAGDRLVAVRKRAGSGSNDFRGIFTDALGSVDTRTGPQGTVTERMSHDSHGRLRGGNWISPPDPATPYDSRGYGGHENLRDMELVHMGGRVYDPVLGRFLSADPFIQWPDLSQSHNRYAYALNNPLRFTDPSGYLIDKLFEFITGAVVYGLGEIFDSDLLRAFGIVIMSMSVGTAAAANLVGIDAVITGGVASGMVAGIAQSGMDGIPSGGFWGGVSAAGSE